MDVAKDVTEIIAEYKGLEPAQVTPNSTFEELAIDSLAAIDIIYEVEDRYGIDIPPEALDLENTKTIGDVIDVVQRQLADGTFEVPAEKKTGTDGDG